MARGVRDRLRRRRRSGEDDVVPGGAERLRHHGCEFARQEAAIEADDERITIDARRRLEPARRDGDGIAHTPDVVERVAVGDHRTPAVSAESNVRDHPGKYEGGSR